MFVSLGMERGKEFEAFGCLGYCCCIVKKLGVSPATSSTKRGYGLHHRGRSSPFIIQH